MKYEDFYRQIQLREKRPNLKNELIAKKVLLELSKKDLPYPIIEEFSESLLYNYFCLKDTEYEEKFNVNEIYKDSIWKVDYESELLR